MPPVLTACTRDIAERQFVRENLLPPIFNANRAEIESLFNKGLISPQLLLTKASYCEGYFSKGQNEFICFRNWQGVSPLQAAYLCGDGPFLGRQLLAYIH